MTVHIWSQPILPYFSCLHWLEGRDYVILIVCSPEKINEISKNWESCQHEIIPKILVFSFDLQSVNSAGQDFPILDIYSPCPLASGGTSNVKITESSLPIPNPVFPSQKTYLACLWQSDINNCTDWFKNFDNFITWYVFFETFTENSTMLFPIIKFKIFINDFQFLII